MNSTADARYALGQDVLLLPVQDGSVRLLDMGGQFYAVPPVGARMLRCTLEQGATAAAAQIAAEYHAQAEQVRTDLAAFLHDLQQRRLIRNLDDPRSRRGPGGLLARLALAPLLVLTRLVLPGWRLRAKALLTLAWLCFRLLGWSRTVAAWKGRHPQGQLPAEQTEALIAAVDEAVRQAAASHFLQVACKERALCCWALLRAAGVPATLVVGVNPFPLAGHCWCEAGTHTLTDDRDRCDSYLPVIRYQ